MPKFYPAVIVGISFLYAFFCGIGRLWAQSKDYPWRNAIFRDLILRDWPVMYPKFKGALVYYIGQWLPAALPGKLARVFGAGEDAAFLVGNIALLIYVTIGLSILFLLLISYFKPKKNGAMILVIIAFIFFSGMDILGSLEPLGANGYHLEWWADIYQYSSFTTCMCWVFNQSLIPWICMALLLKEKNVSQYILIGMSCLISGPFPFIGYFIYAIVFGIKRLVLDIRNKQGKVFLKNLFSLSNILSTILVFPFVGSFLLSNVIIGGEEAIGVATAVDRSGGAVPVFSAAWIYLKFILVEFGVYAILIAWKYKKNLMFCVTVLILLIFPFFRMGYSTDFTMRASIPAIFMMYVFCVKFLLEEKDEVLINGQGVAAVQTISKDAAPKNANREEKVADKIAAKGWDIQKLKRYGYALLVICMILGAATPMVEFIRGFRQVRMRGIDDQMTDYLYTLGGDGPYNWVSKNPEGNFTALNLDQQTFFVYFAKETSE
ncbi:MAG: hypothetical protein IKI20_09935 [Lachnospiraceae bacterium]|nr:hypothetical protein [Lachnospiraceae bacterium]